MINRLMPLPMPYSSICSPSHIRKTVPAVMVSTAVNCQLSGSEPSTRNCRVNQVVVYQKPHVEPALTQAQDDRRVAGVFVDFLPAALAFLLQLFQRRIDAAEQLEDDRGRDVGHDAQAEDRGLVERGWR